MFHFGSLQPGKGRSFSFPNDPRKTGAAYARRHGLKKSYTIKRRHPEPVPAVCEVSLNLTLGNFRHNHETFRREEILFRGDLRREGIDPVILDEGIVYGVSGIASIEVGLALVDLLMADFNRDKPFPEGVQRTDAPKVCLGMSMDSSESESGPASANPVMHVMRITGKIICFLNSVSPLNQIARILFGLQRC